MDMIEVWKGRVLSGVRLLNPDDAIVIAVMCYNAEQRGEKPNGVWHQAARWYRNGENCNCVTCAQSRFLRAGGQGPVF